MIPTHSSELSSQRACCDGGHHGEIARRMTALLCGDDPRKATEAADAAKAAIDARLELWDDIHRRLPAGGA